MEATPNGTKNIKAEEKRKGQKQIGEEIGGRDQRSRFYLDTRDTAVVYFAYKDLLQKRCTDGIGPTKTIIDFCRVLVFASLTKKRKKQPPTSCDRGAGSAAVS